MRLSVVGAGPAYTNRLGATGASYLVRSGPTAVLLDLGQGSFPRLASLIRPEDLTAVVVSHLHPDHFIDLVPLRHYLRFEHDPPRRVRVLGPDGLAGRLDALHAEPGFTAAVLDVERLVAGERPLGGLRLEARLVTHTAESYAVRLSDGDGHGLVYSGDCGAADDLAPLIRPGDDLLVEVSFGTAPVPAGAHHLNAGAIVELAAAARPRRVLLTHIQMGFDRDEALAAVRAGFDGPVVLVEPGFETDV